MDTLDPPLVERLRAISVDPLRIGDPDDTWRRLRQRFGPRITLVDRYALEAAHLGIPIHDLATDRRHEIAAQVLRHQSPTLEFVPASGRATVDAVEVVPYDPSWPKRFATLRVRLSAELGAVALAIDHVGSTAVRHLPAKPIIDIQVSVADVEDESAYVPAIERAAAPLRSREAGHRFFRPPDGHPRDVHVHACDVGSGWERQHLLLRDYLRSHPAVRDAYARLKTDLAERYRDDRLAYTDAKSPFILDALEDAAAWAARTGWQLAPRLGWDSSSRGT